MWYTEPVLALQVVIPRNSIASLFKVSAHGGGALAFLQSLRRRVPQASPFVRGVNGALSRYTDWHSERFDRRYGVDTHTRLMLANLTLEKSLEENLWDGWRTGPICPDFFREIMRQVRVPRDTWTFLDVGAGKGRALILAHQEGFRKVMALEFSAELIETAKRNVAQYKARTGADLHIEWAHADATTFDYPLGPSVLFLNNPFPGPVALGTLERIERSLRAHPRPLKLVYRRPRAEAVARLETSPLFRPSVSTPYWVIYEASQSR